jgi:hypothetical protein
MPMPRPKDKRSDRIFDWNNIYKDIISDKNDSPSVTGLFPFQNNILRTSQ